MKGEVRYALRRLAARPWQTAVVVAILAVGSGAAMTVFRIADVVLLRSLPYQGADRLVHIAMRLPMAAFQDLPFSDVGYRALEHRNRTFEQLASYRTVGTNLTVGNSPERVLSARVTGTFFGLLGLGPQKGRVFVAGEESQKGPTLIVLSDAFWHRRFGAKASAIGSTVRIDGLPATIIGVADRRTALPLATVDYWTLLDLDANGTAPYQLGLEALARVKDGVALSAAVDDASRIVKEVARENPGPHATATSDFSAYRATLTPLRDDMVGGIKPTLALLVAAVLFVLCLTCINVATLELVRSSARRSELAIRAALGADRRRLVAGALMEGAAQAIAGVAIGFALSALAVRVVENLVPDTFGANAGSRFSPGVLAAAVLMVILCTAASGIFPIAAAMSADLQSGLRERGGSASPRMALVRRALVIAQITFACVLVNGAALMILTVREAQRVSLGFRPEGLVTFQVSLTRESYRSAAEVSTAYHGLVEKLRGIPGVQTAGLVSNIPLGGDYSSGALGIEGRPFKADGTDPNVDVRIISAGYLAVMELKLLSGRLFVEGDGYLDGTPVLISETTAHLLFPDGSDPLGHRIRTGPYAPWLPIAGVVSDVRNRSLTLPSRAEIYIPFGAPRSPFGIARDMTIMLRTTGSPSAIQAAAQRVAMQANPDLPVYGVRTFRDVISASQQREITTARTLSGFAIVALCLAVAGSYAMLMFSVVQRKRELALRQAIGARARDILALIAGEMGRLLAIGVVAGLIGSMLLARLMSRFLFGVSALDYRVTLGTVALVSVAGLVAALIPARRAAATDPMLVLRAD